MIKIPTRYWRAPGGSLRAKHMSFVERGFKEQYAYHDNHRLSRWMKRTVEDRQRRLRGKLTPPSIIQIRRPEARVTMGSDMPPETAYNLVERLGSPLAQECEKAKEILEYKNQEQWFNGCGMWKRGDLRPTVTAKSKSSTTAKSASIAPLNVDIEATGSTSSTDTVAAAINTPSERRECAGEHLPDVFTPTIEEDIGAPRTPTETSPSRRSSLSWLNMGTPSRDDQKTRHSSAAP